MKCVECNEEIKYYAVKFYTESEYPIHLDKHNSTRYLHYECYKKALIYDEDGDVKSIRDFKYDINYDEVKKDGK
jgi:hypothetical protein